MFDEIDERGYLEVMREYIGGLNFDEVDEEMWQRVYKFYNEWLNEIFEEASQLLEKEHPGSTEFSTEGLCDGETVWIMFKVEKVGNLKLKSIRIGEVESIRMSDFLVADFPDASEIARKIHYIVSICYPD